MRVRAPRPLFGAAIVVVAAAATAEQGSPATREPRPASESIVVAQVPATSLAAAALAAGSLRAPMGEGGRLVLVSARGTVRVLTTGFDSAADPEVSFDGASILFAARKAKGDPWCVWEMRTDGSGTREVTCGAAGARQPLYQSTLYTITATNVEPWTQVAFVGTDPDETNEAGLAPNTSLWSCKTDGSALRRLTFNLSNDRDPVILPDGRMVYASWLRHSTAHGPQGRVALLGVNEDGTDAQIYAGDEGLPVKRMPAPTANGLVVFVESNETAGDGSGRLGAVSQVRPLHSYRSLSGEADGLFRAPAPLPDGRLLVAWRPAAAVSRPERFAAADRGPSSPVNVAGQPGTFGIYRFDPETKARQPVIEDPAWHSIEAKLVAPRPMPDGRSSVVREDDAEGKLYAVDVGIHDLGDGLPRGTAKRLRVIEGVAASKGRPVSRRLLGEVPLADDGSFQVQVPANTPVQLQLVDVDGLALRTSAWLWVRNHAAQGCVGCHEDPERTPPNRLPNALRSPAPVLNPPVEKRRTVTYERDVKPIVDTKCVTCHGPGGKGPRSDLGPAALAPGVSAGEARRSRLLWHLLGRNASRPWDAEASAPAPRPVPAGAAPSVDEIRAFAEWIDLGGQP